MHQHWMLKYCCFACILWHRALRVERGGGYLMLGVFVVGLINLKVSLCRLHNPGDKIYLLDFLITCAIYNNPRKFGPGKLTDLRSALVNNTTFACVAVRNGFHKYFKRAAASLDFQIENFVKNQNDINHEVEFFVSIF